MVEITHEAIRCPHCRGDLSITEQRGQTTCPHCQAPILLAGAGRREQASLALSAEFGAFIADSVVARRGKEVILHGWHRSGHPEVVIKLRPQLGATWSEKTRHPNVVRFLNSGTEAVDIVFGPADRHHFDSATSQAERHRPQRTGACPVDELVCRRGDETFFEYAFYSHSSAPFFHS